MVSKDGIIHVDPSAKQVPITKAICEQWYLLAAEKAQLDKHYILKWTGDYFRGKLVQAALQEKWHITHDGVIYVVQSMLRESTPVMYSPFVFLSFRRIAGKLIGVVLAKPIWNTSIGKRRAQGANHA